MKTLEINQIEEIKNPIKLFNEQDVLNNVIEKITSIAKSNVNDLDVNIAKNRKAIASVANKVARSKTLMDFLGKGLVADLKKQVNEVDTQRRYMRNKLDSLKEEVRKPLTEWEQKEKDRIAGIQSRIDALLAPFTGSVVEIEARIADIEAIESYDSFAEFTNNARIARNAALQMGKEALEKAKAEQEAERKRKEAEKAAKREREKSIMEKALAKAREESAEKIRQAQKACDDAERRAEKAETLAQTQRMQEVQQLVQEEIEEVVTGKTSGQSADADRKWMAKVNCMAMTALIKKAGLDKAHAKFVVVQIIKGKIPHISIEY